MDDITLPAVVLNPRLSNDSNHDDQVFLHHSLLHREPHSRKMVFSVPSQRSSLAFEAVRRNNLTLESLKNPRRR